MKKEFFEKTLIYGILLLWTFICLFPIYWTATTSFKTAASVTQGLLIIIAIISIVFGVFYKMTNEDNLEKKNIEIIDLSDVYLINENQYQKKIIKQENITFQIIDIDSNKILKEIIIEKN